MGPADDPEGLMDQGQRSCAAYRGRQDERGLEYSCESERCLETWSLCNHMKVLHDLLRNLSEDEFYIDLVYFQP